MPRIEVDDDICLRGSRSTEGCRPDDDYDHINGMNFVKTLLNTKCVLFLFSLKPFYCKMNSERYYHKCTQFITKRTRNACQNVMKHVYLAKF